VFELLRDPHAFFAQPHSLRELTQLAETAHHALTAGQRGKGGKDDGQTESLANPISGEHVDVPPQHLGGLAILPGHVEGVAEKDIHRDLVGEVEPYAQIEGPSSDLLRTILLVREVVVVRKGDGNGLLA